MNYPAGRNKAIITYISLIGLLIAMSMNSDLKEPFATKHIKNMFGLSIIWIVSQVITIYINPYVGDIIWGITLMCLIYSVIRAYQGKLPNIPFVSKSTERWFTFLD